MRMHERNDALRRRVPGDNYPDRSAKGNRANRRMPFDFFEV
jgi:hypothetical protein